MKDPLKTTRSKKDYMRLMRIEQMMIDGFRASEITEMVASEYQMSRRHAERLLERVKARWRDAQIDNPAAMKMKYVDRLEGLYRRCLEAGQFGTAVKIQDQINRLVGLYTTEAPSQQRPAVITISGRTTPQSALELPASSEVIDVNESKKNGTTS